MEKYEINKRTSVRNRDQEFENENFDLYVKKRLFDIFEYDNSK